MKTKLTKLATVSVAYIAAFALSSCEVEKTNDMEMPDVDVSADSGNLPEIDVTVEKEGNLPSVDVDATGGELPKFDVDVADVDLKMKEKVIEVPKVDVSTEEKVIKVPAVDVEMPVDKDDPSDVTTLPADEKPAAPKSE